MGNVANFKLPDGTLLDLKDGEAREEINNLGDLAHKDSATGSVTPSGTISVPEINVNLRTVSRYTAASSNGGGEVTSGVAASCTLPTLSMTVQNKTLSLAWTPGSFTPNVPTAVTLPSFEQTTVATGVSSATSTRPTFTGSAANVTVS